MVPGAGTERCSIDRNIAARSANKKALAGLVRLSLQGEIHDSDMSIYARGVIWCPGPDLNRHDLAVEGF